MMSEHDEKLGRLAQKIDSLEDALLEHMEKESVDREKIEASLKSLHDTLTKYKGFVGGVIFVVSAIWAVVAVFLKFKV